MPDFRPGLDLARDFYREVVRELVEVPHAAALLGEGSEVLGYDQPRSTDHGWGPRLLVFVSERHVRAVTDAVESGLPERFAGWPVRFFDSETGTVRHHVGVGTLGSWLLGQLGVSPGAVLPTSLPVSWWLAVPQQHLLQVTAGEVFTDEIGELTGVRDALAHYPRDVWLWLMASQWHLIGNAEPLVGRCAEAGDERGGRLVATRLVRLLAEQCFLQERRYWPYPKWFGTAFGRLPCADRIGPLLDELLDAREPAARERALVAALETVAGRHNELGVTPPVDPACGPFDVNIAGAVRPYRVLNAGRFVTACRDAVSDRALRELVTVGGIDQLTHADDALVNFTPWPGRLRSVYQGLLSGT
ncbi:DUF4037 domain-containing protein [Pseudonocardia acaciae]|uniref:DUF4037 domain-containing protein n=1 Tax=Pseudonocardia acaciae TaxID=551276 RepID=UPI00056AB1C8|nr:DUF4037 domain-containing protein [Pseudonocardia acaciae]